MSFWQTLFLILGTIWTMIVHFALGCYCGRRDMLLGLTCGELRKTKKIRKSIDQ